MMLSPAGPGRRELLLLAGAEALERFSYYGVRGLLVLFLTASAANGGLEWGIRPALQLLGWSIALAYTLPVAGGWLADRFFGRRTAVHAGAAVLVAAYGLLAGSALWRSSPLMLAALALVAVGTGLFKPNITALVGSLFDGDEAGREGGFLVFYLFMNLGVLFCGVVIGTLGEVIGWHLGFLGAAIAMVIAAAVFARGKAGRGALPSSSAGRDASGKSRRPFASRERAGIVAIAILGIFATLFWMGLEQSSGLLNLFAYERTQRAVFGMTIPATWFQSVNPLYIVALAPGFAWLWGRLATRGADPRTEWKFVIGLVATGCAFAVMSIAAGAKPAGGLVSPVWLLIAYLLLTIGELCIWTISLAAVTRLSPERHAGSIVGLWYLAIAIGGWLAGQAGSLAGDVDIAKVFTLLACIFVAAAVLLAGLAPLTSRLMRRALHSGDDR